jgi:hypothetical protein
MQNAVSFRGTASSAPVRRSFPRTQDFARKAPLDVLTSMPRPKFHGIAFPADFTRPANLSFEKNTT